ncbi:MAG: cupin domain-containing protein [Rhodocyclaceae bacterium]|nr:cupin domain-containing protein [Rhodocyclaceae bacterium]
MSEPVWRRCEAPGRWQMVHVHQYKAEGSAPFRDVTRQLLFAHPELACEWRYFEIGPGGHTTLERHDHRHAVMILRGAGACLVGREVRAVRSHDLVEVPAWTWHQFRATEASPLGFLCLVNADRDRPCLPSEVELTELRRDPKVAAFIRC